MPAWKFWSGATPAHAARSTHLAALVVLAAFGCNVETRGELSLGQCKNDVDDDGDHLEDCADPDCWVYAQCSDHDAARLADGGVRDAAAISDAEGAAPRFDAPHASDDDAGDAASTVGGSDKPPPCGVDGGSSCASHEFCLFGQCAPKTSTDVDDNRYLLSISWAQLPPVNRTATCFDGPNLPERECFGSGLPPCTNGCEPDVYVITLIDGVPVNRTTTAKNKANPTWSDPAFEVMIEPGATTLEFSIMDSDPTDPKEVDDELFSCVVDLSEPTTSGGVMCRPQTGLFNLNERDACLTIEILPVSPPGMPLE